MKKDVEKIVLIVVLVFVLLGAGALAFFFPSQEEITDKGPNDLPPKPVKIIPDDEVGTIQNDWMNPPDWTAPDNGHHLFLSDRYLVLPDGKIIPVSPEEVITPNGITLGWAEKFDLDITDGNLELRDPDNDGFYNLLEFIGKTNPRDAESHPPFVSGNKDTSRLRMDGYTEIKFGFILRSVTPLGGKPVFFMQKFGESGSRASVRVTRDMSEKEQRELLNGYILGDYREKKGERMDPAINMMRAYDDSELDLLQPEIDRKVTLIVGKETSSPDSTADFIMLLPGQLDKPIKVRRGDTFSVPQEPGVKYILMDVKPGTGAVIRRMDEGKEVIDVPEVKPEEKAKVPQGPQDTTENPPESR